MNEQLNEDQLEAIAVYVVERIDYDDLFDLAVDAQIKYFKENPEEAKDQWDLHHKDK